jgi:hypothetical protein
VAVEKVANGRLLQGKVFMVYVVYVVSVVHVAPRKDEAEMLHNSFTLFQNDFFI